MPGETMTHPYGSCQSLLVAQDHSLASRTAARLAIQVAKHRDLLVRGLYVVDERLVTPRFASPAATAGMSEQAELLMDHFRDEGHAALHWLEVECRSAGVPVAVDLQVGDVPQSIASAVGGCCLLALGKRGHVHAADPDHLGHNFRAVANRIEQPLLVGGDEKRDVQHLLLAYNGSLGGRRALQHAAVFRKSLAARLSVLAVKGGAGETDEWADRMRAEVADAGLRDFAFIARQGKPATEILAAADDVSADMVFCGRFSDEPPREWIFGTTVDQILKATHLPMLVA
jgi:nucleotide-binding universal stress UspA family protein